MRICSTRAGAIAYAVCIGFGALSGAAPIDAAPQPFAAETVEEIVVRLLVEGGKLLVGANHIVVELHRPGATPDAIGVALVATRADVPAQSVRVQLSPDGAGRFAGTLTLPWTGKSRMELAWHDEHGDHSHEFVVPVVAGHH